MVQLRARNEVTRVWKRRNRVAVAVDSGIATGVIEVQVSVDHDRDLVGRNAGLAATVFPRAAARDRSHTSQSFSPATCRRCRFRSEPSRLRYRRTHSSCSSGCDSRRPAGTPATRACEGPRQTWPLHQVGIQRPGLPEPCSRLSAWFIEESQHRSHSSLLVWRCGLKTSVVPLVVPAPAAVPAAGPGRQSPEAVPASAAAQGLSPCSCRRPSHVSERQCRRESSLPFPVRQRPWLSRVRSVVDQTDCCPASLNRMCRAWTISSVLPSLVSVFRSSTLMMWKPN